MAPGPAALARALSDGRIEACVLDGAEAGFASRGSPLHDAQNLYLTPRLGSYTRESRVRASWYVAHRIHDTLAGAAAADVTGSGHDGTVVGATWSAGLFDGGLSFDGVDDRVEVAHALSISFDATQSYTLSLWVNAGALPGARSGLVTKAASLPTNYGLLVDAQNRWTYAPNDIVGPLAETGWHHLAAVQNLESGERVLFVHTGGLPSLFAYQEVLLRPGADLAP